MAFDATSGGDPSGFWCRSCQLPIWRRDDLRHVNFDTAPEMTGPYHADCSKPFSALARVMNMTLRR